MGAEIAVIISAAILTAVGVNFVISIFRRHEERSRVRINVQHVLDDASDVSLSVKRFTEQIGGHLQ